MGIHGYTRIYKGILGYSRVYMGIQGYTTVYKQYPSLGASMIGYLSADIICSEKRTVFRERSSRKTVSFKEQIMSKDKYPSIFSQPN